MAVLAACLAAVLLIWSPDRSCQSRQAHAVVVCTGFLFAERAIIVSESLARHLKHSTIITDAISAGFEQYRIFLTKIFFPQYVKKAMQGFTQQMSAAAMYQTFTLGTMLDAKQQLETQRLFQEMETEAQRDYQPSEDFCWFGTAARSLAGSEQGARYRESALSSYQIKRQLRNSSLESASESKDRDIRWNAYKDLYCDPADNNGHGMKSGDTVCPAPRSRPLNDVNYASLIDDRRTLDVAFTPNGAAPTADEQDVIALSNNLYGHELFEAIPADKVADDRHSPDYLALRSVVAKRAVAQSSFDAIVGLKSSGADTMAGTAKTSDYLRAIMKELGVTDDKDLDAMIGKSPSYYAQLEILAKKIYQNPDFFANLYDTPANVKRKSVALKAIELMLDRAIYESQMRQEMLSSVLLAAKLQSAGAGP